MDEYYGQINGLILDLLIPVRTEKKTEQRSFLKIM